jgi:hypothetical protein
MFLFPTFKSDPSEYAAAERFWCDLWQSLEPPAHWTTPWLKTSFANGQPFRDGNPIFSALSEHVGRAIRIIQTEPDEDEYLTWWLDDSESPSAVPITCLVVSCVLSTENSSKLAALLHAWIRFEGDPVRFAAGSV